MGLCIGKGLMQDFQELHERSDFMSDQYNLIFFSQKVLQHQRRNFCQIVWRLRGWKSLDEGVEVKVIWRERQEAVVKVRLQIRSSFNQELPRQRVL